MTAKCPRCFFTLSPDLYAFECMGRCPARPDPQASALAGVQQSTRPLQFGQRPAGQRRWTPPVADHVRCSECGAGVREVCGYCRVPLLREWRSSTTVCIALAGARATGKSIYLGVAIKHLEELFLRHGAALQIGNEIGRRIYAEHYESVLYERRGIMPSTRRVGTDNTYQSHPLIWTYRLPQRGRVFLVVRDVAGEDLESPSEDERHLSYFQRADAALFLFDPSAVSDIREMLRDYLPPQSNTGGDPERAFGTMLRLIGGAPVPIGMVLSKFDTIQALKHVNDPVWRPIMSNPGAALSRDPGLYSPGYDSADGDLLDQEVRSLLHLLNAQQLINALTNDGIQRPMRFFAVSALGDSAEGDRLHTRGIAPYRCLDPLRWAMALRSAA